MSNTCPDTETLEDFLKGRLPTTLEQSVGAHIDGCDGCQRGLDKLLGVSEVVPTSIGSADIKSQALDRLMAELKAEGPGGRVGGGGGKRRAAGGKGKGGRPGRRKPSFLDPPSRPGYIGRFDTYDVVSVVGRGGMGVVLKGHDPTLDRVVAIKLLAPHLATNSKARQRFMREARSAAAVTHENVAPIYLVSEWSGIPFLVMPLITGGSLQDAIDKSGALGADRVADFCTQIGRGLGAAHARGLIHRDIKPTNLMLDGAGRRVTIVDFGLARCADDAPVTKTGAVAGTPQYMAPEQAMGQRVDHRADLYSLGAVAYAMCTGRSPFAYPTVIAVIRAVCDEEPRAVQGLNDQVPDWLAAIVSRLMAKDPDDRFQTADEVVKALQHRGATGLSTVSGAGAIASSADTGERGVLGRYAAWLSAGGVGLVLLFMVVWVLIGQGGEPAGVLVEGTPTHAEVVQAGVVEAVDPPVSEPQTTIEPAEVAAVPVATDADRHGLGESAGIALTESEVVHNPEIVVVEPDPPAEVVVEQAVPVEVIEPTIIEPTITEPMVGTNTTGDFILGDAGASDAKRFQTLGEAVGAAVDGGIIEIDRSGLIEVSPVVIGPKRLTIRAARGAAPVLVGSVGAEALLTAIEGLTLEGLSFEASQNGGGASEAVGSFVASESVLSVANCKFDGRGLGGKIPTCIDLGWRAEARVRNSEFYSKRGTSVRLLGLSADGGTPGKIMIGNSVHAGRGVFHVTGGIGERREIRITGNHFAAGALIAFDSGAGGGGRGGVPLRVDASDNVLDVRTILVDPSQEEGQMTADHVQWVGGTNLYSVVPVLSLKVPNRAATKQDPGMLWDWVGFGGESLRRSPRGVIGYANRVHPWAQVSRDQGPAPTAADFEVGRVGRSRRLARSGVRDIEGLGARLEQVGPGEPYERFRRSGAYTDWSRDIADGSR